MARCGCAPTCECTLLAGRCTTLTGTGNPDDPYIFEVTVDNASIFCTPAGLEARLFTNDTNTVDLSGNGTQATPLFADVILTPDANVPDPDAVGQGNLIKLGPTGIYVSCEDVQDCVGAAITQVLVSDCLEYVDATNTIQVLICGEQNGVECAGPGDIPGCPDGGLSVIPSSDANNDLIFGTDGRLFANSTGIAPGDCMLITGTGTPVDPFVLSPQVAPELNGLECIPGVGLSVTPSGDANNGLIFGTDQRLWVDRCPFLIGAAQLLVGNVGPCFELIGDGCNTPLQATLRISSFLCNGVECRADGLYVEYDTTAVPDTVSTITNTPGFPGLGPFNGTGGPNVVSGPNCVTITNPSPCRNLVTTAGAVGFTDVGRQNGRMTATVEIADGPGGPFTAIHENTQAEPTPPSRATRSISFSGNEIVIAPGGSRTVCTRVLVSFQGVQTGRLFFSEVNTSVAGRWTR